VSVQKDKVVADDPDEFVSIFIELEIGLDYRIFKSRSFKKGF
jgi:hypothetical protein